jgi:hypothetical protein
MVARPRAGGPVVVGVGTVTVRLRAWDGVAVTRSRVAVVLVHRIVGEWGPRLVAQPRSRSIDAVVMPRPVAAMVPRNFVVSAPGLVVGLISVLVELRLLVISTLSS